MITPKDCWLKDSCKKYKNNQECDNTEYCIKLYKINELYNLALLSDYQRKQMQIKFLVDDEDSYAFDRLQNVRDNILEFVENGSNLFIHSPTSGNGKTSWAIKLLQAYIDKIWYKCDLTCKVLFINVPKFLLALKDNIEEKNEYITHIKKYIFMADLVIWDDIATKFATEFESEHLLSMIDTRINSGKSNIFTSNRSGIDLVNLCGQRLASRIENLSSNVVFYGHDKRKENYLI